ncbi:MAG: histidine kinase [Bacteroidota bacterium]
MQRYCLTVWFLLLGMGLFAQSGEPYALINEANQVMNASPDKAFPLLQKALTLSFKLQDTRAESYCYLSLGAVNYELGQYDKGEENFRQAQAGFRSLEERDGMFYSTLFLGLSLEAQEEYDQALEAFEAFLLLPVPEAPVSSISSRTISKKSSKEYAPIPDSISDPKVKSNRGYNYKGSYRNPRAESKYYSPPQKFSIRSNPQAARLDVQQRVARIKFLKGENSAAYYLFSAVAEEQQKNNDVKGLVQTYNSLGLIKEKMGQQDSALRFFDKAGNLAENNQIVSGLSESYDNIERVYGSRNQPQQQIQTRQRALANNAKVRNKKEAPQANLNLGKLYLEQEQEEAAIPYFKQSINLLDELGSLEEPPRFRMEPFSSARTQGEASSFADAKIKPMAQVEDLFKLSNAIQEDIAQLEIRKEALSSLAQAYEQKGDLDSALVVLKATEGVNLELDSLKDQYRFYDQALSADAITQNMRIANLIQEQELKTERIKRLEKEQELSQAQLKTQRNLIWSLGLGLVIILAAALFMYRSYQARRRANMLLTLKSLRTQMNPHFIFNSLNSVNSFIARQDERSANKYLTEFSRLMRTVMENSQHEFVPLKTELEVIARYLKLEHFRFADQFSYEMTVADELEGGEYQIPPMLIQPYIENAVWHGLRYKKDQGFLKVAVTKENEAILVTVSDNGIGRDRSMALKTRHQQQQKSTGLKNTKERLRLLNELYHQELTVTIEDFDPEQEDTGTLVHISIPLTPMKS